MYDSHGFRAHDFTCGEWWGPSVLHQAVRLITFHGTLSHKQRARPHTN